MNSRKSFPTVVALLAGLILLAACPFVLPVYWTMILTEIMIMGLLAMSFNLLFGYTGLLSFGQAGFFGVGAYATALFLSKGGESLLLGLAAALGAAAVTAAVIGALCVRRDEIYFAIPVTGDKGDQMRTIMEIGELAFWPPGHAFCIFWGPTPASEADEPRAASDVVPIGKLIGDFSKLADTADGQPIRIEQVESRNWRTLNCDSPSGSPLRRCC